MGDQNVYINIEQPRDVRNQVFGIAFVSIIAIALIIKFWVYIVAFLVGAIVLGIPCLYLSRRQQRINELCAAADRQNAWYHRGDPRGTFGEGYGQEVGR